MGDQVEPRREFIEQNALTGATRFPLADKVEAMPLRAIAEGFGSRMT